jgi:hypothetical protein
MEQSPLSKFISQKYPSPFMGHGYLIPCSKEPAIGLYSELDKSVRTSTPVSGTGYGPQAGSSE